MWSRKMVLRVFLGLLLRWQIDVWDEEVSGFTASLVNVLEISILMLLLMIAGEKRKSIPRRLNREWHEAELSHLIEENESREMVSN